VRARITLLAGGAAVVAAAAYKLLRARRPVAPTPLHEPVADSRADELREKLAASREVVDEREAAEERETPVDEAVELPDPADSEAEVEELRRTVHERGRGAVAEMRTEAPPPGEP
jgi:hypothetical protein